MKYTTEKLEEIAKKLLSMPPVEKRQHEHSKIGAIVILSKEIESLQKRGYTIDQISETLRGEGLDITTPTLKSYLQRAKAKKKPIQKAPKPQLSATQRPQMNANSGTFAVKPDAEDI